jgi:drug/metabolite transporter (DMT)-like permease
LDARSLGSARLQADGVLLFVNVLWGVAFTVVKGALSHGDPFSFLSLRFLLGALALSAVARGALLVPSTLRRGGLLGLFLFLGFALQTVGLVTTTPSRSAFITGLYVVFVPVLGLALFRRVPRASSLLGVVLAALGLYFLTGSELGGGLSVGDGLTLGGAVAYAFHILFTERYAREEGVSGLVAVQLWAVCGLSVLCLPFTEVRVAWTPAFLGAVAVTGLLASAGAIWLQTWAQARTTAVRAALICASEPVFAALFSVAVGVERLGAREWTGGVLILLGVVVAEVGGYLWDRLGARRAA